MPNLIRRQIKLIISDSTIRNRLTNWSIPNIEPSEIYGGSTFTFITQDICTTITTKITI